MSQKFLPSLGRPHQHPHCLNNVMPSDSGDRRPTRLPHLGAPPPEPEHLPCPRCDSTNTKFCYYNNYNFSQPRHFCKACRRYWTQGGTLRNIPVGGGSRKNAKRCRTISSTTSSPSSAGATQDHRHQVPVHDDAPVFLRLSAADYGGSLPFLNDAKPGLDLYGCGGFASLLSTDSEAPVPAFGLGPFEDMGFSVGRAVWPFPWVGDGGAAGVASTFGNTWQLDGGEGGDCFSLPDLAISTPLNALK